MALKNRLKRQPRYLQEYIIMVKINNESVSALFSSAMVIKHDLIMIDQLAKHQIFSSINKVYRSECKISILTIINNNQEILKIVAVWLKSN